MANTLITLKNASLAFGDYPLLDNTDFSVQEGERIGLIGRNGTGKSSMLQVLARKSALDDGEIQVKDGLRVVLLEQEPVFPPAPTIRESLIAQSGFDPSDDKLYWKQIAKLDAYLQRRIPEPLPAASGRKPPSRSYSLRNRTCCCSMSRRTTSTSPRSRSSRI